MNVLTKQILETTFDTHNRHKALLNVIKAIKENKGINETNRRLLLEYNDFLEREFSKGELSVSAWQKNIAEAHNFTKFFSKPLKELVKEDIEKWWKFQEDRQINKEITTWTVLKYCGQARKFLRFCFSLPKKKYVEIFDWIPLPKSPKQNIIASELPSQKEIKKVIEGMYVEGKRMSIRNQAVMALCNDVGCRISEALSLRNMDIQPEKNYLVVSFPKSKTSPRTVISFLAKPFLENWAKVSPNKDKGSKSDVPFFCTSYGKTIMYAELRKQLIKCLKRTEVSFPKGKKAHFFRKLFATRSYAWSKAQRDYWMGWSGGISDSYTHLDYRACVKPYFEMLKEENNPMLKEDEPFWDEQKTDDKIIEKLKEMPEFNLLLRRLVREA